MFNQVLRHYGTVFDLYLRGQIIDCPNIDRIYGTADRDCSICKGTGSTTGYTKQANASFLGMLYVRTEGSQDQHQRLYGKMGPIDTLDARLYCEARWYELINIDDVLVWKPEASEDGYELKIISKNPNIGMINKRVYTQCDVTKNPFKMRVDATDLRKRI